jgi:predicted Zn-ribbon and HTH transcriptional regulator
MWPGWLSEAAELVRKPLREGMVSTMFGKKKQQLSPSEAAKLKNELRWAGIKPSESIEALASQHEALEKRDRETREAAEGALKLEFKRNPSVCPRCHSQNIKTHTWTNDHGADYSQPECKTCGLRADATVTSGPPGWPLG